MATLDWVLFCRKAVIDAEDNNVSLHSVLNEIHPLVTREKEQELAAADKNVSMIAFECMVALSFARSEYLKPEGLQDVMIKLVDPNGRERLKLDLQLDLHAHARTRAMAKIPGIPAYPQGMYSWRVFLKKGTRFAPVGKAEYLIGYVSSEPDLRKIETKARKNATIQGKITGKIAGKKPTRRTLRVTPR